MLSKGDGQQGLLVKWNRARNSGTKVNNIIQVQLKNTEVHVPISLKLWPKYRCKRQSATSFGSSTAVSRSDYEQNPNYEPFELKLKRSKIPLTLINTRDCFAYDLIVRETIIDFDLCYQ